LPSVKYFLNLNVLHSIIVTKKEKEINQKPVKTFWPVKDTQTKKKLPQFAAVSFMKAQ